MSCTGFTVPSALETCVAETSWCAVRGDPRTGPAAGCRHRHGSELQHRAGLGGDHLPRHDVRVVLEDGDDDLVAGQQMLCAPGLRDEIDGLGGAADEDDLLGLRRVDETPNRVAGLLIGVGGAGGQLVGGAVDIGVLVGVEVGDSVDDRLRLLSWSPRCRTR